MRRRSYLGAVAALASAGTAGCLGVATSALPGNAGDGPGSGGALPPCRSFGLGDGATVCAGDQSADVVPTRNAASVSAGDDLVLTLTNESAGDVGVNPYAWTAFRRGDDGWTQVAPDPFVEPRRTLERDESLSWHLMVGSSHSTPDGDGVYLDPLGLDAGAYAFVVVAVVDGDRTEFVAPFAVD